MWYMGGLLFFFAVGDWSKQYHVAMYFIWSMVKDTAFIGALYLLLIAYRKIIFPVLFFSIFRSVWEIIAQIFSRDINETKIVDLLFYILCWITIWRLWSDLKVR